jgi:hypothetical protein
MTVNDYHLISNWRVQGTVEEVQAIIANPGDYARWWSAAWRTVRIIEPGDANGKGCVFETMIKGWLPYRLHVVLCYAEVQPGRIQVTSQSDLDGSGVWTFEQDGIWARVSFAWNVRVTSFERFLSYLFKPVLSSNHHWIMAKGREGLKQELARRQETTPEEMAP